MTASHEESLGTLTEATNRLIRGVDALGDEDWKQASTLPGWTRAHVVAHLTLNAEGLAGVLTGIAHGHDVPMYASQEQRDADIEVLAGVDPAHLRERFLASTQLLLDAAVAVRPGGWAGEFRRVPAGGVLFPRIAIPQMREHEVQIHHADLLVGYTPADWPAPYLEALFKRVVHDREDGPAVVLRTPQGDVALGRGEGPVVAGSRADLTWWLLGRGAGEGLTTDGELPVLGAWR